MEAGSANLGDIYRKKAFLRDSVSSRRCNGRCNRRCNSLEFLFHLPEAIAKVLSVRTCREYLNLSSCLLSSIFLLESSVTNACVSLVNRVSYLGVNSLSFRDDLSV